MLLGVALSGAAGSAEEVVGLPEMFVGATMLDGPVGPGRLPKESTARSGFSCPSPERGKGRITNVYETLSPLEAGSGVSIICSLALSLKERAARACKQARRSPRRSPPRTARVGTVRWDRTHMRLYGFTQHFFVCLRGVRNHTDTLTHSLSLS